MASTSALPGALAALLVAVGCAACDETEHRYDGGPSGKDAGLDAGLDAGTDGGMDGGLDGSADGGADSGADELEDSLHTLRGGYRVAGILLTFEDNDEPTDAPETLHRKMFTAARSLDAYYREVSYGRFWLEGVLDPEGDVFGPVAVPYPQSPCQRELWATAAQEAAAAEGFDLGSYDYIGYFHPGDCGGIGRPAWTPPSALMGNSSLRAQAHEMGHAFGFAHSAGLLCSEGDESVVLGGDCEVIEYGDFYDVMGGSGTYTPNLHHRGTLGWLEPSNTLTAAADGAYDLEPIEIPTDGVQVLRVPRMIGVDRVEQFVYVELRQSVGFDDFPDDSPVLNGVLVRLAGGYDVGGRSYLLDMHPDPGGDVQPGDERLLFEDAALLVDETFVDDATGLQLRVLDVGPAGATVDVALGTPLTCTRADPLASFSPDERSAPAGDLVTFPLTLQNQDADCPPAALIGRFDEIPPGWEQKSLVGFEVTLGAGLSGELSLEVRSPKSAAPGPYDLTLTVTNLDTNRSTTASARYVVE